MPIDSHPGLAPILASGVSVAKNGEIYNGAPHRSVKTGDEVFLMQKIKGG